MLISASADETFGMAVVEALGAGLPAVYVECPALEELPEHPAHAHQVATAYDAIEAAVLLAAGIGTVLGDPAPPPTPPTPATPAQRFAVPRELTERYGADGAVRRNDALYRALRSEGTVHGAS